MKNFDELKDEEIGSFIAEKMGWEYVRMIDFKLCFLFEEWLINDKENFDLRTQYEGLLLKICTLDGNGTYHANERQRCKAFMITMDAWKEEEQQEENP